MADIAMRYSVPVTITYSHTSAMSQCKCGAIFKAEGTSDEVSAASRKWDAEHVCPPRPALKSFWLSFCDNERPVGSQFLGACVIDVTSEEAEAAQIDVMLRFPFAEEGAEWIAAAVTNAHALKCNPGGEVATVEVPPDHPMLGFYKRGVLMDKATIARIDDEIGAAQK